MMRQFFFASAIVALSATMAFAIPSGGSDTKSEPKPAAKSPKKLACKRNETVKRVKRAGKFKYECVKLQAGALPDDALYQQARLLAEDGEYEWALDHLRLITKQGDKEVLNYTGYAHRKAGRVETGISYYQQALSIDPNFVQAREYLGEAYMLVGFKPKAEEQLREIALRCAGNCEAYVALRDFIQKHRN
jgi:Flp pilus assembly protein TadD